MKDLSAYLKECGVLEWWRAAMGYVGAGSTCMTEEEKKSGGG